MNAEEIRALKDELDVASLNLRELLQRHANKLIMAGHTEAAGRALVFDRIASQQSGHLLHFYLSAAPMAEEPEPAKRGGGRARKGQGAHRHKFNEQGVCDCGAKRKRAPRGQGERSRPEVRASADQRTQLLPLRPADDFADGTMGGSGARR